MIRPTDAQYSAVAKALHWLIALLIIGMLAVGWIMKGLPNGADKFSIYQLHKSVGITILVLVVLRLLWRLTHRPPDLPETTQPWEKIAAHLVHIALYALIIAMPLVGWVMVSTSSMNIPTMLYGVIPLPYLPGLHDLENKKDISHLAAQAHNLLAWVILGFVALHVLAALKHHFIDRDDVILRMTPNFMTGFLNRLRGKSDA